MEFYRQSGAISLAGIPIVLLVGTVGVFVLAMAYGFGIVFCPFVYGNVLLTGMFALGIGWVVAFGARLGKIRNRWATAWYALLLGILALYFAWAADFMARFGVQGGFFQKAGIQTAFVAFYPSVLADYIKQFYTNGFWTIGGHGQNAMPAKGLYLGFVWLLETVAVLGGSVGIAFHFNGTMPFCETCNRWTRREKGVRRLQLRSDVSTAVRGAREGDLDSIVALTRAQGKESQQLRLDLACCPSCQDCNYLTIVTVERTVNDKGKTEVKETVLFRNMAISSADVGRVREAGRERHVVIAQAQAQAQAQTEAPAVQTPSSSPSLPASETQPSSPSETAPPNNDFFDFLGPKG
jgi:hypothetical protein